MPYKCCVGGCKTNYLTDTSTSKKTLYSFPKSESKKKMWLDALPNKILKFTNNMKICSSHWPEDTEKERLYRSNVLVPKHPPSIFRGIPSSFRRQTISTKSRQINERRISITHRSAKADELAEFERLDTITSFNDISGKVKAKYQNDYFIKLDEEKITIFNMIEDTRSASIFITVKKNLQTSAFKSNTKVPIHDILGFGRQLSRWSQLEAILNRSKVAEVDTLQEMSAHLAQLRNLVPEDSHFLLEQLDLRCVPPKQRRYSSSTMHIALQMYLSSRAAYRNLEQTLCLPSARTLKSQLGRIGDVAGLEECRQTIKEVIHKLNEGQRRCILLFDEMYVKASLRYRGRHLLGAAIDSPEKPAKTILAIMITPMFGGPSFVCRLLPVLHLTPKLLSEQVTSIVQMIKENGGTVMALICDNHPTNRAFYASLRPNPEIPFQGIICDVDVVLLNDTVHIFKSVRNNWITEKNKRLSFQFEGSQLSGNWNDIIQLYEKEKNEILRRSKMSHSAVYPNAIDRQKVSLFCEVFNEKTVAALFEDGKEATASFLDVLVKCWNLLNTKSPTIGRRLNDPVRIPITSEDDVRLSLLQSLANSVKSMRGGRSYARTSSLTTETRDALVSTLEGLVFLTKRLLRSGHSYVLLGQFQTDRLEGEFGIYRQLSGGNYFIAVEQVLSSLQLQRLKLFDHLELVTSVSNCMDSCCSSDFTDNELQLLDESFCQIDSFSAEEMASLYYVCGYVAFKVGRSYVSQERFDLPSESEFQLLVSRGRLCHPIEPLVSFSKCCYNIFKKTIERRDKLSRCANRLSRLFLCLSEVFPFEFGDDIKLACNRFANIFFKGFVNRETRVSLPFMPCTSRSLRKLDAS